MVVDLILQYLPQAEIEYHVGDFDPRNYRVNFQKIQQKLGFKPSYSVERSVKTLIQALQQGFFFDAEVNKVAYGNYEIQEAASL